MKEVISLIKDYVKNYKEMKGTETDWREPIVGIADAGNPMFLELKDIISPSHALPSDFINDAKSVIVFFLPFQERIVKSNIGDIESSREWDIANIETNNLIVDINKYLHEILTEKGYTSTVLPPTYNYDEKGLISDWSHRHVGYIAGIGTFGINNMLITEKGCCGRMGSIITNMALMPIIKKEQENCLYKHNGTCGKCIDYCVANAISIDTGYPFVDKKRCNNQIYDDNIPQYSIGIGDACGKCMCNVPCSLTNPVSKLLE
ncbi:epoxyqueuosine reductase [Alkaliphilus hydrothermalis]|uniref:Epoxyqueuosine reductase QueG n=1 Tax=Alkaliphilus hydrothermalis TaxID=1482730 RepID=A0ABS2NRF2_9FIRM|nr:epoxyqueuosine reductase [Alkaliphilus hydrothermalis]MBM7615533.1 epoxyqueuosine reductase QueG [Alkaliphilus hydrothermalis]